MRAVRRFRREEGSATIEFVILFPAIMTLFLSAFEVGIYLTRAVLLDRAVDLNVRALRLGALNPATPDELRRRICNDTLIFADCPNAIAIELVSISTSAWNFPANSMTCIDRTTHIRPKTEFNLGKENEIMIIRACAVFDPFFGTTPLVMDLPLDKSGGYVIAAASTFVNEP